MQTDLGLNFLWDVRKLWAVDLPVVPMRVRDLEWLLGKPFWKDGHRKLALRPCDVAAHPQRYQADYERAMAADLSCPNQCHLPSRSVGRHGRPTPPPEGLDERPRDDLGKQANEQHIPLFSRKPTDPPNHQ